MKILVTGGAGFIGSAVIRYLIEQTDHQVLNVDKLTYAGNLQSLQAVADSPRYQFSHTDIGNADAIAKIFEDFCPDAVMHLAAESHVDRSISGAKVFVDTNVVGTFVLLEASRTYYETLTDDRKARFRFHHISTDEVFGDLAQSGALFCEDTAYAPSSPYAATKASSDHLVRAWGRTYGLPIVISNCSNNYGPYQFPEKLIPLVILNAINGKPLPIYGDGCQIRDWLYVDDHAQALYLVLTQAKIGESYNIGGHNELKNIEVVHKICAILEELRPNKPTNIAHYKDLITFVADRKGHDVRYAIDASKIKNQLGWQPQETFETGLRKTITWYLNNEDWVNNVQSGEYQNWLKLHYQDRGN